MLVRGWLHNKDGQSVTKRNDSGAGCKAFEIVSRIEDLIVQVIMQWTATSSLAKVFETYDFISPSRFAGKLKGKVAIVTGASAGLGREAALAFAAAGASVAVVARRKDALDTLVSEIKAKHGVPYTVIVADVSDPASPKKILDQTEYELGAVDILLNCAGISRMSTLAAEADFSTWWRVLEVNLRGSVALVHAVLPSMIARKTGVIIGVTSLVGVMDFPFISAYSVSKAAIAKFHHALALEVAKQGVLSFAVHPGAVRTDIYGVEGAVNPAVMEEEGAKELLDGYMQLEPQSARLMGDVCVALCADSRFEVLNGRYIDCEQHLDVVLAEAEKEGGGRLEKDNLYRIKVDEL